MKKIVMLLICLLLLSATSGCVKVVENIDPNATAPSLTNPVEMAHDDAAQNPTDKPILKPTATKRPMPSFAPTGTRPICTEAPEQTPIGMSPDPVNTATFYSSYAHMVSYDPARGWADFDYFDILTGQDAIDWMVDEEGYSVADATDIVDDWGDGEHITKNTNPQLRTIDLKTVPIELMFHPDGTQSVDSTSIPSSVSDVFDLYNLNPDYLYTYFFFYIHVDAGGNVIKVQQIYWC